MTNFEKTATGIAVSMIGFLVLHMGIPTLELHRSSAPADPFYYNGEYVGDGTAAPMHFYPWQEKVADAGPKFLYHDFDYHEGSDDSGPKVADLGEGVVTVHQLQATIAAQ